MWFAADRFDPFDRTLHVLRAPRHQHIRSGCRKTKQRAQTPPFLDSRITFDPIRSLLVHSLEDKPKRTLVRFAKISSVNTFPSVPIHDD